MSEEINLADVRAEADERRALNGKKAGPLVRMGAIDLNDMKMARFGFFSEYLVKIGVLTEEQMAVFDLEWEKHLADQLDLLETKAREALHHAQQQARANAGAGLIVPGSSGLVVPGNSGGASRAERRRRK